MRCPVTNSARSHQCEPMSANARDAPPRSASTRQLSSSGRSSQSCRYVPCTRRTAPVCPLCGRAHAPRGRSRGSGRRTGRSRPGRSRRPARSAAAPRPRRPRAASRRRRACRPPAPPRRPGRGGGSACRRARRRRRAPRRAPPRCRTRARRPGAARPRAERSGVDAATPTSRAPASRAARACTAPMNPVPAMPTRKLLSSMPRHSRSSFSRLSSKRSRCLGGLPAIRCPDDRTSYRPWNVKISSHYQRP